jgi:hypothetical protein
MFFSRSGAASKLTLSLARSSFFSYFFSYFVNLGLSSSEVWKLRSSPSSELESSPAWTFLSMLFIEASLSSLSLVYISFRHALIKIKL